jgi:hypothetical protein
MKLCNGEKGGDHAILTCASATSPEKPKTPPGINKPPFIQRTLDFHSGE